MLKKMPVHKSQFSAAGNPSLVCDPLVGLALVEPAITRAISLNHPDSIVERTGIKKQAGVIRAKLQMGNRIATQNNLRFPCLRISYAQARIATNIELDCPPAVIRTKSRGTHGRSHHAFFAQGHIAKVDQLLLLERGSIYTPASGSRCEVDVAAIV